MDYETILLEIANGAARLTLNRPDRLNSFTVQMHDEVSRALEAVTKSDARVLVLTGAGRGFCAGQDLSDRAVAPGGEGVDLGESLEKRYNPLIRRLTSLEMPVICAVNGVAAGAGANIALACDIVIAAKSARSVGRKTRRAERIARDQSTPTSSTSVRPISGGVTNASTWRSAA